MAKRERHCKEVNARASIAGQVGTLQNTRLIFTSSNRGMLDIPGYSLGFAYLDPKTLVDSGEGDELKLRPRGGLNAPLATLPPNGDFQKSGILVQ